MHIGITGYAKAGKDEVADILIKIGFVKINMSDALHKYLMILNPYIPAPAYSRYSDLVDRVGYVKAKEIPEVRELLQRMGTEVGRRIDPDMWIKEVKKVAQDYPNVVTTGIRYPNEAMMVDILIAVHRPGVGPVNDHSSDNIDHIIQMAQYRIHNDGTLDDLNKRVLEVVEDIQSQLLHGL